MGREMTAEKRGETKAESAKFHAEFDQGQLVPDQKKILGFAFLLFRIRVPKKMS